MSFILLRRPLLILMSPCLDLMVGSCYGDCRKWSMCWSMAGKVLIWLMSGKWLNLLLTFSLSRSQLHLLRLFGVHIGWS